MKCPSICRQSLPVLMALGLVLATAAAAWSAPARRGAGRAPGPAPNAARVTPPGPNPHVNPHLKAVPPYHPDATVRVGPRVGYPVVVPPYVPRPLVRAGVAAAVIGGPPVVAEANATVAAVPAELIAVPTQEFSQAQAYQVVSVADDYSLTLLVDGQPTRVRLLGVAPPLVAEAGQPGVLPPEALAFVRGLLLGEQVYVADDSQVATNDADGIRVAYVHRAPDGLLVNLELIRQGYGLAAEGYAFDHQQAFVAYQTRAQQTGKGIWHGLQKPAASR